jgi:N-methylhydantoinase B
MFRTVPAEYQEAYYPLSIDEYSTRADTGGAGEFRGGHGITKVYTFEEDGAITFQDDRAHTYPWGVDGGTYGQTSEKRLIRADGTEEELPSKVEGVPVSAGDKLVFSTAGGGGLGDPLDRDPETVAAEVERGLVSEAAARSEYGVVLAESGGVDESATEGHRDEIRSSRADLQQFDYGPLADEETLAARIREERETFENGQR